MFRIDKRFFLLTMDTTNSFIKIFSMIVFCYNLYDFDYYSTWVSYVLTVESNEFIIDSFSKLVNGWRMQKKRIPSIKRVDCLNHVRF